MVSYVILVGYNNTVKRFILKIGILTDSHFGIRRSSSVFEKHILDYHRSALDAFRDSGIDTVLHLGDFFDTRGNVSMTTLKEVKDMLDDYPSITWHMIVGNHDTSYKNTLEANSVSLLFKEYADRVKIYETPEVITFSDKTSVLAVPWITKQDEESTFKTVKRLSKKTKVCAGHFEFMNFEYLKNISAQTGMDSEPYEKLFDIILTGHYHNKSDNGKVFYLGTGTDFNWGDYDIKKYYHTFDTETLELTPIEYTEKLFWMLSYNEDAISPEYIDRFFEENTFRNKIIKVVIKKSKNGVLFNRFMDTLYSQDPYSVDVVDEQLLEEKTEIVLEESSLSKTNFEIIKDYIDDMKIENTDVILKQMYELYRECDE